MSRNKQSPERLEVIYKYVPGEDEEAVIEQVARFFFEDHKESDKPKRRFKQLRLF